MSEVRLRLLRTLLRMRMPAAAVVTFGLMVVGGAVIVLRAQSLNDLTPQLPVSDPTCPYFGNAAQGTQSANPLPLAGLTGLGFGGAAATNHARSLSALTAEIATQLP